MNNNRNPLQIILIEQLLYSFFLFIFLALFLSYGPAVLIKSSHLDVKVSTYIFIGSFVAVIFAWFYIWLPYTFVRIWRSATRVNNAPARYLAKLYSGLCFVILLLSGLGALWKLPEIIEYLSSQGF